METRAAGMPPRVRGNACRSPSGDQLQQRVGTVGDTCRLPRRPLRGAAKRWRGRRARQEAGVLEDEANSRARRARIGGPPGLRSCTVGCRTSAIRRSSVDFPQPDGPIRAANSPRATSRVTSPSAGTGPPAVPNTIETARQRCRPSHGQNLGVFAASTISLLMISSGRDLPRNLASEAYVSERLPTPGDHVTPSPLLGGWGGDVRDTNLPGGHFHVPLEPARALQHIVRRLFGMILGVEPPLAAAAT